MKSAFKLVLAMIAIGPLVEAARAETVFHRTTHPGTEVFVANEAQWDKQCASRPPPTYDFETQPENGSVSVRAEGKIIKSCAAGGCECLGKSASGAAIYYTPKAGFRGRDHFRYVSRFSNGSVLPHEAIIDVR